MRYDEKSANWHQIRPTTVIREHASQHIRVTLQPRLGLQVLQM